MSKTASELITVETAAAELGLSKQMMRRYCAQGRVQGAQKLGRDWLIPSPPQILPRGKA